VRSDLEVELEKDENVGGEEPGGSEKMATVRYLLGRVVQGVVVIFGAIVISFILTDISGNPAKILGSGLSPTQVRELEIQLGYNRPVVARFFGYIGNVAHGNFGSSYRYRSSALLLVLHAFPYTLMLVGGAIALATVLALPISVFSLLRRESVADRVLRRGLMVVQGVPEFWLGIILTLAFGVELHWLPIIGFHGPQSLILPDLALGLPLASTLVRLTRGYLLDVAGLGFMTVARSKGLSETSIVIRHGLRNAMPQLVTFLSLQMGWLIGGTLIVEAVFAWPGIGSVALSAVQARDLTVVQAVVVVVAAAYVILNIFADILVYVLDPRIRRTV
jgi:peptide/nickel transport system permease protein